MTDGKRILIIDDVGLIGQTLSQHMMKTYTYCCDIESSPEIGLTTALNNYFDMIVVDLHAAHTSSLELCRALRANDVVAPIMVLLGDESESATISLLDAGATDCVVKPFKLGVLVARIRAHIRQFEHSEEARLAVGPFLFNVSAKTLTPEPADQNGPIRLTDKETQIIKYLFLHATRLVSREELLGEVWGYNAGITTHTLETHIYRLRQKMEVNPSDAKILVTQPGGYRLFP